MPLAAHTRLGPYEVLDKLGAGGMGEVYRASDTRLEREVAIKILPERFAEDPQVLARFQREAKAVASLSHPNIITIYDIGTEAGRTFAVMELLTGQTLGSRLRPSTMDWHGAVGIAIAVAEGLGAAHARGVIHRDVKPANIFLTSDGGVKVLDFGLARVVTASGRTATTVELETDPGVVMGTVSYMPPEQIRGQPADARSDIFALGCVLYEMVGGRQPFEGNTVPETFAAILHNAPSSLPDTAGEVPPGLENVIQRCLEKDAAKRFQSAQEFVTALRNVTETAERVAQAKVDTDARIGETAEWIRPEPAASVAVLPFVNVSPDPENEYFSDGLAEELIAVLSKVDGLHVVSRTSSFAFKAKSEDVRKIGEQLNVIAVVEGSVRKAGNRLRISAQLTNVATGYQLWSESYNRQLEDIFEIQDEIAQHIAKALQIVLKKEDKRVVEKASTVDVEAYDYFLRGRQFFHQFRQKGFEYARQMFAKAIEIDPGYARAYAGIADCHALLYSYWDSSEENLKKADEFSQKALQLAREVAETRVSRGMALMLQSQFAEAQQEFETAIQYDPSLFEAYYFYGRARLAEGKLEAATELFERAAQLRPDDYQSVCHLGGIYDGLGHKEEALAADRRAVEIAEKHLSLHPDDARALYLTAVSLCRLGDTDRSLDWAGRALAMDPNEPVTLYNVGCVYALQGESEQAVDCLQRAVDNGFGHKEWFENDSDLDSLREHPRFQSLLGDL